MKGTRSMVCAVALAALGTSGLLMTAGCASDYGHRHHDNDRYDNHRHDNDRDQGDHHDDHPGPG